jgi:nucleotide-binding universal stress UspA family protein
LRPRTYQASLQYDIYKEKEMRGTIVCGVDDTSEGRSALDLAAELSDRLALRLVVAHVADGIGALDGGDGDESVTMRGDREGAARVVARLTAERGLQGAERRWAVGDPATLLGRIADEEAADLIVVGSRDRGWPRRGLESKLARKLETATPVPIVIAPPRMARNGRSP